MEPELLKDFIRIEELSDSSSEENHKADTKLKLCLVQRTFDREKIKTESREAIALTDSGSTDDKLRGKQLELYIQSSGGQSIDKNDSFPAIITQSKRAVPQQQVLETIKASYKEEHDLDQTINLLSSTTKRPSPEIKRIILAPTNMSSISHNQESSAIADTDNVRSIAPTTKLADPLPQIMEPEMGIKTLEPLVEMPYELTLPICPAWLQELVNSNIRFPFGRIHHPPEVPADDKPANLFGKTIKVTLLADEAFAYDAESLIKLASQWLNEFERIQDNTHYTDVKWMNAFVPGDFTESKPIIYGPKDKGGFIPNQVKGYWTDEKVRYNRAKFLKIFFEECPSYHGKIIMAVTICLMTLSSPDSVTVIQTIDQLIKMSRESMNPNKPSVYFISDGAYARLHSISDDIFRHVYLRLRRLHEEGPLYKYSTSMKGANEWLNMSPEVFKRDNFVNALARKTPIQFKKMSLNDYRRRQRELHARSSASNKENFGVDGPGDKKKGSQKTRNDRKKQSKAGGEPSAYSSQSSLNQPSPSSSSIRVPPIMMPDEPSDPNHVVCCMIFPRGHQDITENLNEERYWEGQLFWYLMEWYYPGIHKYVAPLTFSPINAITTSYEMATGIREMKVWLDEVKVEEGEEDTRGEDLSQIFQRVGQDDDEMPTRLTIFETASPLPSSSTGSSTGSSTYTVRAQHLESHLAEECYPVPTEGWDPYPHVITFVSRRCVPLPSPRLLGLHRAVSMAATHSGAWGAGDEVIKAERPEYCKWCRVEGAHYCLPGSMKLSKGK
ncbi:hypothetical protein ABW20_dc0103052 [Dactylellina cionopaga]|nr:hypothetical protein ABW20_dc0103052 [Dactylellina cionopaga]